MNKQKTTYTVNANKDRVTPRNSKFSRYLEMDRTEAGFNLSWGSIIAGIVTFLGMNILFATIGSAIGFGMIDLTSNNPIQGAGTGLKIWMVISLILSFLAAGFISGVAARRIGLLHGFLTWASSLVVSTILLMSLLSSILSMTGTVLGKTADVAGNAAGATANVAGQAIEKSFAGAKDAIGEVNTDELQTNVNEVLKDTDIKELQPDYLQNQLKAAGNDVTDAGKEILVHPNNSEKTIDNVLDKLQKRADKINEGVDKDAVSNAIAQNTDLSQAEADKATNNIVNGFDNATKESSKMIENARTQIENTREDVKTQVKELRETADNASDSVSKGSIWLFVGLLLSMILSTVAGLIGSNLIRNSRKEEQI